MQRIGDGVQRPLARDWLVSSEDEAREREGCVSTLEFDERVQEFQIGDGRLDIGVLREEIRCAGAPSQMFKIRLGWYSYRGDRWVTYRGQDLILPDSSVARELRPLGLKSSPVEFVRTRCEALQAAQG